MRFTPKALLPLLALLVTVVPAEPVNATPPEQGSGVIQPVVVVPSEERSAAGKTFFRFFVVAAVAGTAQGTAECEFIEKTDDDTGDHDLHGRCTFTGSIAGSGLGTVELTLSGRCTGGLAGSCESQFHALPGTPTGGLSTLQLFRGSFVIPVHVAHSLITYRAEGHFKH